MGDIVDIQRGGSPRPIQDYITNDSDGLNWIKIGDVNENDKYIYQTKEKIKPEGLKKTRMVYEGDFILSNSMSFGRPYIMKTSGCIHDGWLLLRPKKEGVFDKDYLYYMLMSSFVYNQFVRAAKGGVVNNLNSNIVADTVILLPSIDDQRRIVAKLEAEQEIIDANKRLIDLMQDKINQVINRIYKCDM